MLQQNPTAKPLAGGTDLLVQNKEGRRADETLLSLKRLPTLHGVSTAEQGARIGAATKVGRIAADPAIRTTFTALAAGANLIGSIQIRNMATIGGNICNASPSADTAPPLLVLDAEAVIEHAGGERVVPLVEFFEGPGRTVLAPGELLTAVHVPAPPARTGSAYLRHTPRAWMDIAFVGVAAAITLDDAGRVTRARIALGAVAPTPVRAVNAEQALIGQRLDEELIRQVGELAAGDASPIDDLRASAEYRRHLVRVLTARALWLAEKRARNGYEA